MLGCLNKVRYAHSAVFVHWEDRHTVYSDNPRGVTYVLPSCENKKLQKIKASGGFQSDYNNIATINSNHDISQETNLY